MSYGNTKTIFTKMCYDVPYVAPYVVLWNMLGNIPRALRTHLQVKEHHENLLRIWWNRFGNMNIEKNQNQESNLELSPKLKPIIDPNQNYKSL
jgi:hypothetical protein